MKKQKETYAVLGLGRYGRAVAKELVDKGMEVLAVDVDPEVVQEASAYLPICKKADVTVKDAIKSLGVASVDTAIICMANNLEASVLAVTICKGLGVKKIIAKCRDEMHREILRKVGANEVYFPESESGVRLARRLISSGFVDVKFMSNKVSMVDVKVKEEWKKKKLSVLNIQKYGKVVAVKNGDEIIYKTISPRMLLKDVSILYIVGDTAELSKLK